MVWKKGLNLSIFEESKDLIQFVWILDQCAYKTQMSWNHQQSFKGQYHLCIVLELIQHGVKKGFNFWRIKTVYPICLNFGPTCISTPNVMKWSTIVTVKGQYLLCIVLEPRLGQANWCETRVQFFNFLKNPNSLSNLFGFWTNVHLNPKCHEMINNCNIKRSISALHCVGTQARPGQLVWKKGWSYTYGALDDFSHHPVWHEQQAA